jgi:hypothetical protein
VKSRKFPKWTSSEINDSLAFAVVYNDNGYDKEYAVVLPKTEKSAIRTEPSTIVAICVKE